MGAIREGSGASGVNGDQFDGAKSSYAADVVYLFKRSGTLWQQQAYLESSNPGSVGSFGTSLSLSANGNDLAIGTGQDNSAATGINGDQFNSDAEYSGVVWLFTRDATNWQQRAYIKVNPPNISGH